MHAYGVCSILRPGVCVCDLACERLVETLWRPHLITAVACMMLAMQMHAGY
jgi:hypothetical protein